MDPDEAFQISATYVQPVVCPEYAMWIELLFWLVAAGFTTAMLIRERTMRSLCLCLACCCFALGGFPMVLSFFFPNSETAMRMSMKVMMVSWWTRAGGAGLFATYAVLRWRRPR